MMHENIDMIDALMVSYVAGSLPKPVHVLVESHLWMKDDRRDLVSGLEALAGDELDALPAAPLSDRDAQLAAIFESKRPVPAAVTAAQGLFPPPLQSLVGFNDGNVPWRSKLPGYKEYTVEMDGLEVSLMWIRPGRRMPLHTHQGTELTLILHGAYSDGHGRYGPGDISVADGSVEHRPVAEKDRPCIAFSVLSAPIKLTGSFREIIGDLIG